MSKRFWSDSRTVGEGTDDATIVFGVQWFAIAAGVMQAGLIFYHFAAFVQGKFSLNTMLFESALVVVQTAAALLTWWLAPHYKKHAKTAAYLLFTILVVLSMHDDMLAAGDSLVAPGWTAMFILLFVVMVPSRYAVHVVAASLATMLHTLAITYTLLERGLGGVWDGVLATTPTITCAVLAIALARRQAVVHRLLSRPKELGSYHLIEKIGEGGMGEVWRAEHRALKRPAAVKIVRANRLHGGDEASRKRALARFEKEARLTADLTSPHTVRLFDFETSEDGVFYAMEFLEGMDLQTLVDDYGRVPQERMHQILLEVCDSLEEAHDKGLIHRDVKPANIHLGPLGTRREVAKLLDFGLVIRRDEFDASDRLTMEGKITGSPITMAPEQATGKALDGRADIYSLACTAYYALSGRPVFTAETPREMLMRHIKEAAQPFDESVDIDPIFEGIILQCLRKDPDDRPASVRELRSRLSKITWQRPWSDARAREWYERHAASG